MRTDYLEAETVLVAADVLATRAEDFDTLSRLYLPLQEARRQRRQLAGEGVVRLDLIADSPDAQLDPEEIVARYPQGQLLVAGWESIAPALKIRELQRTRNLYLDTFLAAAYRKDGGVVVRVLPEERASEAMSIWFPIDELPRGERRGTWQTYAEVMAIWERLHGPYLAAADAGVEPEQQIEGYRRTIAVDYACELAHQKLSALAARLSREKKIQDRDGQPR
ncbi:hypothetical protein BH09PLA1_BH09PLA1_20350 [soil metagenome]